MPTRYFVRGLIDGSLSTLGVVIGAFNPDVAIIIAAGVAGSIANGFSNVLAAFSAERTVGYKRIAEVEDAMLSRLKGTHMEDVMKSKTLKSGMIDGLSSIIGGAIPVVPFLFLSGLTAMLASIAIVSVMMGILGAYSAKYSKESMIFSVVKMIVFALVTAGVCVVIGNLI